MSFQAYLDNIEKKTGKSPEDFKRLARTLTLAWTQVRITTEISVVREGSYWVRVGLRPSSEKAFC